MRGWTVAEIAFHAGVSAQHVRRSLALARADRADGAPPSMNLLPEPTGKLGNASTWEPAAVFWWVASRGGGVLSALRDVLAVGGDADDVVAALGFPRDVTDEIVAAAASPGFFRP